ncbi:MAG: amidophosphoribosyltransferase [Firmicutes bacterium]|nr:amidophosphoribosyltransferase [Bacillota bacterium]
MCNSGCYCSRKEGESNRVILSNSDKMEEACGVFGVYAPGENLFRLTNFALYALQHRGQESAGIALSDGCDIHLKKGQGLVAEVFPHWEGFNDITAVGALGHVYYSARGKARPENSQPLLVRYRQGNLAVAYNGNLTNASELREKLEAEGSIFQTMTDSELIAHLVARSGRRDLESALQNVLPALRGAYSFIFLTEDRLIGLRDPYAVRPLSLGRWRGHLVLSSETCAFDTIGAEKIRDIQPGEMVVIGRDGLKSIQVMPSPRLALCVFEFIYFARPDSDIHDRNVYLVRKRLGRQLAREHPVQADLVTGVPDSSLTAASGFAEELGLPYEWGLIKNRYIGRTFLQPRQETRDIGVQLKLNPVKQVVQGKKVVVVDDSIVRGTTSKRLVNMFVRAGAKEVHLRIASPPIIGPCYYGIDTPDHSELIGARQNIEEIRREIGATTLQYLSHRGMFESVGIPPDKLCTACFSGKYPF